MGFNYISVEQALEIYEQSIQYSGGTIAGVLNQGVMESVLALVQNDSYYPTFIDKLTYLVFSFCKNHCFKDGNKRISILLGTQFLLSNGHEDVAESFLRIMENNICAVAADSINRNMLKTLFTAIVDKTFEKNEELLYELFHITQTLYR